MTQPTQQTPSTPPPQPKEPTHRIQKFYVQARTYGDPQEVAMPKGAEILEAVFFEGRVNLWVKCPLNADDEDRAFKVVQDDEPFNDEECTLIGMAIRPSGAALHIVEVQK